jgi:hypothetical protein
MKLFRIISRFLARPLATPFSSFGSQAEAIRALRRSNEFWRERHDEMVQERDEAVGERAKLQKSFDAAADRADILQSRAERWEAIANSRYGEIEDLNLMIEGKNAEIERLRPLAEYGQRRKDALARAWRKRNPMT